MRKSLDLDHLLENAVASALGLERPHPRVPRRLRQVAPRSVLRRRQATPTARRQDRARAAA